MNIRGPMDQGYVESINGTQRLSWKTWPAAEYASITKGSIYGVHIFIADPAVVYLVIIVIIIKIHQPSFARSKNARTRSTTVRVSTHRDPIRCA